MEIRVLGPLTIAVRRRVTRPAPARATVRRRLCLAECAFVLADREPATERDVGGSTHLLPSRDRQRYHRVLAR